MSVNYIELIRAFWRSNEEHSFGPTEIALYFYLLEVCNICRWKNPFKRNNAKIEADLGMTFYVLKNARNRLKTCGLIDFKTVSGSSNVVYTLKIICEVANEVYDEVRGEVLPAKEKQNETKQISSHSPAREGLLSVSDRASQSPLVSAVDRVERLRKEFGRKGESFALLVSHALRDVGRLNQTDIWNWLDRFTEELLARGDELKTRRDYQSHFVNWLKIKLEKQNQNGSSYQHRSGAGMPPPTNGQYADDL